jgi:cytochrome c peroxidase
MKTKLLGIILLAGFLSSCVKEGAEFKYFYYDEAGYEKMSKYIDIPSVPDDYTLHFPRYYTTRSQLNFSDGMAALGRVLFYDKNLSSDRSISCASCHQQEIGFSDDKAFSQGVQNRSTSRNSLALGSTFNFREYYGNPAFGGIPFFWDNRAFTVSDQSTQTFGNPLEMDMKMSEVVERVKTLEYYGPMFDKEFYGNVSENNILAAISEFVNAIGSFDSKFDKALNSHFDQFGNTSNLDQVTFASFTPEENRGKNIYIQKCASCHSSTFGAPSKIQANNGLYVNYPDDGVYGISQNQKELGLFKVPTLRNITLTGPYMHDGSLATLEDVIDHYSHNIKNHTNLDPLLKDLDGTPMKMDFSNQEKQDLLAFLKTLEDEQLMKEERFSDPFKQ